jgi:hypothetical protein
MLVPAMIGAKWPRGAAQSALELFASRPTRIASLYRQERHYIEGLRCWQTRKNHASEHKHEREPQRGDFEASVLLLRIQKYMHAKGY